MPPRPRTHRLGPHVVGQRVVVRHRLPDGRATDVLGICTSWSDDALTLDTDDGPVVVPLADLVTGKPVPPRPSVRHRVPARDVQRLVASLWDGQVDQPLGEWLLRVAPPYDGRLRRRANSVLAMGDPGVPLAEATGRAVAFYAERGQAPLAQVRVDDTTRAGLLTLGWQPLGSGSAHCMLAPVAQVLRGVPAGDIGVVLHEEAHRVEARLPDDAGHCRAAVAGDWVGVHSLEVTPARRRRGSATRLVGEVLDWAASRGATTAWLNVEVDNVAATALYGRLGFRTHHTSDYLRGPLPDDALGS